MQRLFGGLLMLGLLFLPVHAVAKSCCDQSTPAPQSQTGSTSVQTPTPEAQSAKPPVKPETSKQQQGHQKTLSPQKKSN
jgi:hypothetical protein